MSEEALKQLLTGVAGGLAITGCIMTLVAVVLVWWNWPDIRAAIKARLAK